MIGWLPAPMWTEGLMRVAGIFAKLAVAEVAAARDFYTDDLGFATDVRARGRRSARSEH